MDTYLLAIGWWNFVGSIMMIGFFNEQFGKKMLNEWTKIISTEFTLDYWGKFWLTLAISLNIFFGLINIMAVKWGYADVKVFLISLDLIIYVMVTVLAIWGVKAKRTGEGIYSVFIVFGVWLAWGAWVLYNHLQ